MDNYVFFRKNRKKTGYKQMNELHEFMMKTLLN